MQPRSSIGIDKLSIPLPHGIGLSAFSLDRQPCYVLLSLTCHLKPECLQPSASNGGLSDDWDCLGIGKSVNYSALGKTLYSVLSAEQGEGMTSLSDLARTAAEITAGDYSASLLAIDVVVERPKALLFSDSVNVHRRFGVKTPEGEPYILRDESHTLVIQDLRVDTVIGLHPHEREEAQRLVVDIEMDMMRMPVDLLRGRYGFDYKSLGRFAYEYLGRSSFKTIEALGYHTVHEMLQRIPSRPFQPRSADPGTGEPAYISQDDIYITLTVKKPSAIALAAHPTFKITRCLKDFTSDSSTNFEPSVLVPPLRPHPTPTSTNDVEPLLGLEDKAVTAYIAIGTNLGDRIKNIQDALAALPRISEQSIGTQVTGQRFLRVTKCSQLYESEPMYVVDQPQFINGAVRVCHLSPMEAQAYGLIQISTNLRPVSLLRHLKAVESALGRVKTMINGPRLIDLDLLMYGDRQIVVGGRGDEEGSLGKGCGWLQVPHWGIGEREFVLRPLHDMLGADFKLLGNDSTIGSQLSSLEDPTQPPALHRVIPFPLPAQPLHLAGGAPLIMGILNVTPDSFSDGSADRVSETSLEHVLDLAKSLVAEGAEILDIGGMSTRPGVNDADVSVEQELGRVIPVIQALRIEGIDVPISIDTFRAQVAEQAILAGASCINDVRGGREEGMFDVMARTNVPVILMHSRGDSQEMLSTAAHDYEPDGGVVQGVRREMAETVARAESAGVKSWNIILDPGIGFAKSHEGNLQLLKALPDLFGPGTGLESYAVLVGASRKGFIGKVLDRPVAKEREFGNAAVTAVCCQSEHVDVVRVHEPRPARDVIRMLKAIRDS